MQATHKILVWAVLFGSSTLVQAATLAGRIVDLNGRPVADALLTFSSSVPGPTAQTVFSDSMGRFKVPAAYGQLALEDLDLSLRALGHELVETTLDASDPSTTSLTVIARARSNQAGAAPPSAWLGKVADHDTIATFVMDCIGCHQVPSTEFRAYAAAMAEIPGVDRTAIAEAGWTAMVQYMNLLSAQEFGRGAEVRPLDVRNVYSVGDGPRVINFLTEHFPGRMDELQDYAYGVPLAVTPDTVISEYELPVPNAVREAVLLGTPKQLYVADVASNRLFKVDPQSGYTSVLNIPSDTDMGPHSLHRGPDGSLWVAPFVSSVVAQLDVENGSWNTWKMQTPDGRATGIHDLGFGAEHTVLTDDDGNIWFSDISNNAVGYLEPDTGHIEIYRAPPIEGRAPNGSLYGLVLTADRQQLWFTQLGIGNVGSFNITTREFGPSIVLPVNAGPRRLAISDEDILYVPLYGRGQLLEYDTRTNTQIGLYDLPDRASAPYAATWDPVRKVVWIPTSNADAIYRFDPRDKSFAVLPLPRTGALVRMVDIDPDSGDLVTSYGNIVERVHGPRMALIITPGDNAYDK